MKKLDEATFVSGQIGPGDVAAAVDLGICIVVNNRPDDEEPGQPESREIEAAVRAVGLAYVHIPVAGGFSQAQVAAMGKALEAGPVLAFCRSGTRSTYLWALARAAAGADAEEIARQATAAGYDLGPIRAWL